MKHFIQFKPESITEPSEQDRAKGVKSILSYYEEIEVKGLKQILVKSIKSTVEADPKLFLNKQVLCEVQMTVIPKQFGKPDIYFKASSLKLAL